MDGSSAPWLTGYLGGATAIQVRIGDPFYFPIMMGVLLWGGLLFTDHRLRTLMPLRRPEPPGETPSQRR